MTVLSKSAFAARHGWSKAYVSKLAKQERLVLTEAGQVDVEATEQLLELTSDPSKAAVAERHQQERVEKGVSAHLRPDADLDFPAADAGCPGEKIDFQKARARREHFLARLAENESRKSDSELVERSAVEQAAFTTGRQLRDLMLGLPKQISAELASLSDPWELERRLTSRIRQTLEDAERMSTADLQHLLDTG